MRDAWKALRKKLEVGIVVLYRGIRCCLFVGLVRSIGIRTLLQLRVSDFELELSRGSRFALRGSHFPP